MGGMKKAYLLLYHYNIPLSFKPDDQEIPFKPKLSSYQKNHK